MKILFHERVDVLCCNDRISFFEHNSSCHNSNKRNIMYEYTYNDLIQHSYNHENIHEFVSNHKDLQVIPLKMVKFTRKT